MNCTCGYYLIAKVGEGYVVTPAREMRWMRRRSDVLVCEQCSRPYRFDELDDLEEAGATDTTPSEPRA